MPYMTPSNPNEHLSQCRKDILTGISDIYDFCQNNEKFDEYTYILLWRPIEWIIDYAVAEEFKEKNDPTNDEFTDYINKYNKKTVDQKFDEIKNAVNPVSTIALLNEKTNEINTLRRCRNAVIYHYITENTINPFEYFDNICEAFLTITCSEEPYTRVSSQNRKISLSKFAKIYDLNIEQTYDRLKDIVAYLNTPNHNRVISICKMEELAQLIAYKILSTDFGKSITYNQKNKKGIYVDGQRVTSYIDSLIEEISNNNRLSFKKISQDLQQLRKSRNMALHILNVTEELETDFRSVWYMTINNYFGYDDNIHNLLEAELFKVNWMKSLQNLTRYSDYYKNGKTSQIIVSIKKSISLTIIALNEVSNIYYKYSSQFKDLTEEEKNEKEIELYTKMSTEISTSLDEMLDTIDAETKKEYKTIAIKKFGAKYCDNKDAYHCVETAMILRDAVGSLSSDYAGICIELTRALEIYLYNKISRRLNAYLKKNPTMQIDSTAKKSIENGKTTLGNYKYLYTSHTDHNSQEFLNFCISESIYLEKDKDILKTELLQEMSLIDKVRKDYRNKIAHRDMINKTTMLNCINDILEGGGPIVSASVSIGSTKTPEDNYALLKRISQKMGECNIKCVSYR